jgi:hypothetical protein
MMCYEGMAGIHLFLGGKNPALETFMQVPGEALRLKGSLFQRYAARPRL